MIVKSCYFIRRWVFKLALRLLPSRKKEHSEMKTTQNTLHTHRVRPMIIDTVNLTHLKFQSTENVWQHWSENHTNESIKRRWMERETQRKASVCLSILVLHVNLGGKYTYIWKTKWPGVLLTMSFWLLFLLFYTAVDGLLSNQPE